MAEGECGHVNPDILGDIVISVEKALLEGESAGLAFNEYLDFLIIHGLLHLLGYNHESGDAEETLRMMEKENELFMLLSGFALQR